MGYASSHRHRPDIIVKDHENKECTFIDVAIPADKNTSIKTTEKLSKYKDLEIEVSRMWKMTTKTIPIIIGALGVMSKSFSHYAALLPIDIRSSEVQKITLLGTAHILRRALSTF